MGARQFFKPLCFCISQLHQVKQAFELNRCNNNFLEPMKICKACPNQLHLAIPKPKLHQSQESVTNSRTKAPTIMPAMHWMNVSRQNDLKSYS